MSDSRPYPRLDGAFLQLGPEVFTGDGVEQPQDTIMWQGAAYVRTPEQPRTWVGEALAAYDQSATAAGMLRDYRPTPDFWVSRAQAAASIAAAQEARTANLIAWKTLQQQLQAGHGVDALPDDGDEISAAIRAGLGLS